MIHHFIRGAILINFAIFIAYLVRTEELTLYVGPRMALFVKLSAIGLLAAGLYQFYSALEMRKGKHIDCTECSHDHSHSPSALKHIIIYSMFIFPLLLGWFMPSDTTRSRSERSSSHQHIWEHNHEEHDHFLPSEER